MSSNCELLIKSLQNKPTVWDMYVNATEKEKQLPWSKITDALGCKNVVSFNFQFTNYLCLIVDYGHTDLNEIC